MEGSTTAPDQLTAREQEILERLADGLSDQQIADDLVLSLHTVKWYNRQIYSKLGVANRSQAVARSVQLGLLTTAGAAAPMQPSAGPQPQASRRIKVGQQVHFTLSFDGTHRRNSWQRPAWSKLPII
jgi:DNA-binding CsgD family transcriptional regulator